MSVLITGISFTDNYTGAPSGKGSDTGVPYLMGNIGDDMYATINFLVYWGTVNICMAFSSTGTITRSDTGGSFIKDGYNVGDTIVISGTTSNNQTTVLTGVSSTILTTSSTTFVTENDSSTTIYGQTAIQAIDFYYNLLPNNSGANFQSLSDTVNQKYSIGWTGGSSPTTGVTIPPVGSSIAWFNGGNSTLTYNGISGGGQSFTLVHKFTITPLWLANQLQNLQTEVPPGYFLNNCLKYIYQLDARFATTNPVVAHTSGPQTSTNGNTGWYDEFLNGNPANYTVGNVTYANHSTSAVLYAIDYNNPTDVIIILNSPNNAFTNSGSGILGSPINLRFNWLPFNQSAYQNKNINLLQCLLSDACFQTVGAAAKNGINYGTVYQAFTNVVCTYNSANKVTVSFTVSFGTTSKQTLAAVKQNTWYAISAAPQKQSVTTLASTDRTTVLCDVNQATTNTDDATLSNIITDGTTDVHLYKYPDTSANPLTNLCDFMGSYGYGKMQFNVKTGCVLKAFNVYVVAQNNDASFDSGFDNSFGNVYNEFVLDSWTNAIANTFNGTYSAVSINGTRGYPVSGLQNVQALNYKTSLNSAGYYGYQLDYGFQMDYRYWQALQFYSNVFYGTAGRAWNVYSNNENWTVKLKIVWVVTNLVGIDTVFIRYVTLQAADYTNNGTQGFALGIFDNTGTYNFNGIIASDVQNMVVLSFTGDFSTFPDGYTAFTGQIWFWYDDGTSQVMDMDDTESVSSANSYWVGQPILTKVSDTQVTISGILDITEAPPIKNYRIFARLGFKP